MAREIKWTLRNAACNTLAQGHIKDQHDTQEAFARFGERLLTAMEGVMADGPPFGDWLFQVAVWVSEEKAAPVLPPAREGPHKLDRLDQLQAETAGILIACLPAPLKITIRVMLESGTDAETIMTTIRASVQRQAEPGKGELTVEACKLWIKRLQEGGN